MTFCPTLFFARPARSHSRGFRRRHHPPLLASVALLLLLTGWLSAPPLRSQTRTSPRRSPTSSNPADATAQPPSSDATTETHHLHGVVVDSRTGKPIARALVQAFGDRLATLTDHDGRFGFDLRLSGGGSGRNGFPLPSQTLFLGLIARKPGYNVSRFGQMTRAVTAATLDQEITLKLTPSSVIQGHIAASGDDHPENVRISLQGRSIQEGYGRWTRLSQAVTDSRGDFRFADLSSGEYKLITQEWSDEPSQPAEFDRPASRYAPVSYPVGSTAGSGPDIHLETGESLQVNLNLHPETFFPVHIPIAPSDNRNPGVQVRVFRQGSGEGFTLRYVARDRQVEGLLPGGVYEVALQSNGQNAPVAATVPLTVAGSPVETAPVTLLPMASIPVIVHQEITHTETSPGNRSGQTGSTPTQVVLVPDDLNASSPFLNRDRTDPDKLSVDRVLPGSYRVQINVQGGYVAAATSGGTDLLRDRLVVGPAGEAAPLEITVRDDAATVQGTLDPAALASGNALGNTLSAFLLCLPTDQPMRGGVQSFARPDGRFVIADLPPGSYRIFASTQPFVAVEYHSDAFLERYGSKGYAITLEPNASATVTLTSVIDEEP